MAILKQEHDNTISKITELHGRRLHFFISSSVLPQIQFSPSYYINWTVKMFTAMNSAVRAALKADSTKIINVLTSEYKFIVIFMEFLILCARNLIFLISDIFFSYRKNRDVLCNIKKSFFHF